MKLEALLVANGAMVDEDSLLTVHGAGWRFAEPDAFPTTLVGNVCGTVLVEDADFGSIHPVGIAVFDDHGHVDKASASLTFDCREPSEEMTTPRLSFACPFTTVIREPTLLKVTVSTDDEPLGELAVIVRAKGDARAHEPG